MIAAPIIEVFPILIVITISESSGDALLTPTVSGMRRQNAL
jgi:hypothetical protein